jgi:hypothetical protein
MKAAPVAKAPAPVAAPFATIVAGKTNEIRLRTADQKPLVAVSIAVPASKKAGSPPSSAPADQPFATLANVGAFAALATLSNAEHRALVIQIDETDPIVAQRVRAEIGKAFDLDGPNQTVFLAPQFVMQAHGLPSTRPATHLIAGRTKEKSRPARVRFALSPLPDATPDKQAGIRK